jgi:hypothetical protein
VKTTIVFRYVSNKKKKRKEDKDIRINEDEESY